MKSRRLRLWLVVIIFCLSCTLLLLSAWPEPRERHSIQPANPEQRQMLLEWPAKIRQNDSDWVVLSIVMDPAGQVTATVESPGNNRTPVPVDVSGLNQTHNVVAVARLDLAGMSAWRDPIREPMRPGRPVTFRWSIRAEKAGVYRGVLWLALEFVPLAGGQVESITVLSRPLTIDAVSVLGLPGWVARAAGGAGLVLSLLLGLQPTLAAIQNRPQRTTHKKHPSDM